MKRKKRLGETRDIVTTYTLYIGGRRIRKATKVILATGCEVRFMDLMPKKSAIPQAQEICRKETGNPKFWKRT